MTEAAPLVPVSSRWAVFALTAGLLALPIGFARFPPVLDLAQQVAQIPKVASALGSEAAVLEVNWLAPNRIAYLPLAAGWGLGGATYGPRLGLLFCLIAAVGAVHLLAALFARPPFLAALASIFVLSSPFYGGFFNFVLGGIGAALWLAELREPGDGAPTPHERQLAALRSAAIALLLYATHLLWLAAGTALGIALALLRPATRRTWLPRALGWLPVVVAAALWEKASATEAGFGATIYEVPLLRRLFSPTEWVTQLLGGVKGVLEPVVLAALALCLLWLWSGVRPERRWRVEPTLALAAALFALAALLLPDLVGDTILFGRRWAPWAAICALLALPLETGSGSRLKRLAPGLVVAGFAIGTAVEWSRFDRIEMAGFADCLAAIPPESRLLSLDTHRFGSRFWVYPTAQMAAYAELERDARLGFSFAEHRSSLVVFRDLPRQTAWTPKLELFPARARAADLLHFDLVLLHLRSEFAPRVRDRFPPLLPTAGSGDWRLFRVNRDDVR